MVVSVPSRNNILIFTSCLLLAALRERDGDLRAISLRSVAESLTLSVGAGVSLSDELALRISNCRESSAISSMKGHPTSLLLNGGMYGSNERGLP